MALTALREALPEPSRRGIGRQGCGADRFADERGDLSRTGLIQCAIQGLERRFPGRIETPGARWDVEVAGEVRAEGSVEPGSSREREGLHRRPVIRLRRRDNLPSVPVASFDVIAPRELDCHLDGVRSGNRELHATEPPRRHRDELVRQALLERVGEPLVVHVGQLLGLGPSGGDDVAPAVPQRRRHRPAAHRVQIPTTGSVLDPDALATGDDRHGAPQLEREHVRSIALDGRRLRHPSLLHTRAPAHAPAP